MDIPVFTDPADLFEYVVEKGPDTDEDTLELARSAVRSLEAADGLMWYFNRVYDNMPKDVEDHLFATVRKNILLIAGCESDFRLADFVAAPWDCFAEK